VPKHRKTRSEMLAGVMRGLGSGINTYDHFTYLGRFPAAQLPRVAKFEAPLISFHDRFDDLQWFVDQSSDLVVAKNTLATLDLSVRKMDQKPSRAFLETENHYRAVDLVAEMFEPGLRQTGMTLSEALEDMDMDKATGYVLRQSGYKKKYQVVATGVYLDFLNKDMLKEIPIWLASGKEREYLYRSDYVDKKKQRTFIIEPFELLLHHKLVYGKQNEGMKNIWWSAYGLNPYEGGVNGMAQNLLRFKRFTMLDVIRYDRKFPHMKAVFDIRDKFIADSPFRQWVRDNCIKSRVVLPNGDFIEKDWGNNSGSGTTTGDNILGMAICIAHTLFDLGLDEKQVKELVFSYLFGDDVVIGDNCTWISNEEWEKGFRTTFALYGFEFDPFVMSDDLKKMSFLGFSFAQTNTGFWVPKYDLGVLTFGFIHNHDTIDGFAEISKCISLMLMSAGHGEIVYNKFRSEVVNILCNYSDNRVNFLKFNNFSGVPTYAEAYSWYLGLESSINCDFLVFLKQYGNLMEVDGVQKLYGDSKSRTRYTNVRTS